MSKKRTADTKFFITVRCLNCGKTSQGKGWARLDVCKNCRYCRDCGCHCRDCKTCGKRHGYIHDCQTCRQCKTICSCRQRPGWYNGIPLIKERALPASARVINSLQRPLAVEVELAEWNGIERWSGDYFAYQRVHDGSVRPSGNEMVSEPMAGDEVVLGLTELGCQLAHKGATINNTCGFHVHVDATDFSYSDLRRLLVLYHHFENDIYEYLISPERSGNRFCKKFDTVLTKGIVQACKATSTTALKEVLYNLILGGTPKTFFPEREGVGPFEYKNLAHQIKQSKYGAQDERDRRRVARYSGFNVFSWFHRGSVEFRMKEGLLDPVEMLAWTLLCGWIVDSAYRLDDKILTTKKLSLFDFLQEGVGTVKPPKFLHAWAMSKVRTKEE